MSRILMGRWIKLKKKLKQNKIIALKILAIWLIIKGNCISL